MPIRAVIFDYGKVLCPMPAPADFEPLRELSGIDGGSFQQFFWGHRLEYDRGSLDGPAYWQAVAKDAGASLSTAKIGRLIMLDVALWERIDPILLGWAVQLREAGIKTAILSNMPLDVARNLRQKAGWLSQFDHTTFSGEIGMVKPEPGIYAACLAALKMRPPETLFIDDLKANIDGARSAGMNGLHFETLSRFAKDVAAYDLPAPGGV